MSKVVKCGLIQCSNPLNDETKPVAEIQKAMLDKHMPFIESAAKQGVKILGLQEIFNGPYFCPSQDTRWYDAAEPVPGPMVETMSAIAKKHEMVMVVPVYEREMAGVFYNTAAVIDADGSYLGKHRKNHIPQVTGFWEKFYFRPGNLGYQVFDTAVGRIGVYICYERHFPEGWRALGLAGAKIVFNPSATSRGLSEYLWKLEQTSAAVANEYFVGTINRVGIEPLGDDDFYGQSYFADPRGQIIGGTASDSQEEVLIRDLEMDLLEEVRHQWQFYRDRRPDSYSSLVEP